MTAARGRRPRKAKMSLEDLVDFLQQGALVAEVMAGGGVTLAAVEAAAAKYDDAVCAMASESK